MTFKPYSKEDQLNRSGGIHADDLKKYKNRSVAWMKEKAKAKCHEYVRERDRDGNHFQCCSCGKIKLIQSKTGGGSNYHAGHFKAAGECEMLRYDEVNINGQCDQCNYFKSGNLLPYQDHIIRKWGRAQLNRLNALYSYNKRVPKKWTKIELAEIIKYYSKKLKDLRNASNHSVQKN